MSKTPIISVIVPVYNEVKSLASCLDSLKNQSFQLPYEVLVVDNNSTDNSVRVAQKYNVTLKKQSIQGRSFARNLGLSHARGQIIAITEADCIVPNTWLSDIHMQFSRDKTLVALSGPSLFLDTSKFSDIGMYALIAWSSLFYRWYSGNNTLRGQNSAFRKSAAAAVGPFNHHASPFDDLDFGFRVGKIGKISYVPSIAVRTSNRRIRGRFFQSMMDYIHAFITIFIFKQKGKDSWYPSIRT